MPSGTGLSNESQAGAGPEGVPPVEGVTNGAAAQDAAAPVAGGLSREGEAADAADHARRTQEIILDKLKKQADAGDGKTPADRASSGMGASGAQEGAAPVAAKTGDTVKIEVITSEAGKPGDATAKGQSAPGAGQPPLEAPAPPAYRLLFEKQISDMVGGQGPREAAAGLARLIVIARKLSDAEYPDSHYQQAYLAAQMLHRADQAAAATMVIDNLEYETSKTSPIFTVLRGLLYSVLGFVVLVGLFVVGDTVLLSWGKNSDAVRLAFGEVAYFLIKSPIFLAITFGLLGGVVSILLRISDFESARRRSRQFLLMSGAILPAVGAVFAAVACAIFASKLVNFTFAGGTETTEKLLENQYFFIVIGFLAGFSERFMRGLLGSVEDNIVASKTERQVESRPDGSKTEATIKTNIAVKPQE
ncbi:MAG TPA: hypothetical protein VF601_22980 [Beijerinckiaceae bacterium]|jgi:hypothetical protein